MSRKDYAAIAAELNATRQTVLAMARDPGLTGISKTSGGIASLDAVMQDMIRGVAIVLASNNPRFDYRRFIDQAIPDHRPW